MTNKVNFGRKLRGIYDCLRIGPATRSVIPKHKLSDTLPRTFFCQAQFGVAPEGLNAVDMTTVSGKFIVVMVDVDGAYSLPSPIRL